jgi:hypothetical protein
LGGGYDQSASFDFLRGGNWNCSTKWFGERATDSAAAEGLHEGKPVQGSIAADMHGLQ